MSCFTVERTVFLYLVLNLLHEETLGHKISRKDFQKLSLLLYFVCYFDKEPKYRYSRSIFLYVSRESNEKEVA